MKIRHWNWERQNYDEVEYPEELFRPFLDWLFTTKAWIEDASLVNRKVLNLQRAMADYRQPAPSHQEAEVFARREASELEEKADAINRAAEIKTRRIASLAKARAAKQAKREAAHATA